MANMRKTVLGVMMAFSFLVLFPLSFRVGEALFFTRAFDKTLFDPVLIVCSDHVKVLKLHELAEGHDPATGDGCTFQISPARQEWVQREVRGLQSPNPRKSTWTMHAKQLGANDQRVELELMGDGVAGMIYEVQNERIIPLKSRLTGPLGAIFPVVLNIVFWLALWLIVWGVRRWRMSPA